MTVVYTIGYEGADVSRFLATLNAAGVRCVADVRAIALSRKKGFSKTALAALLEQEGIEYVHLSDLGDPKPGREAARAGRYDVFRRIYGAHLETEQARASFEVLLSLAGDMTTCLLCFERDPTTCHRSIVAQQLEVHGFESFDLYADDPDRYVRHAKRMPGNHPRQGAASA